MLISKSDREQAWSENLDASETGRAKRLKALVHDQNVAGDAEDGLDKLRKLLRNRNRAVATWAEGRPPIQIRGG